MGEKPQDYSETQQKIRFTKYIQIQRHIQPQLKIRKKIKIFFCLIGILVEFDGSKDQAFL